MAWDVKEKPKSYPSHPPPPKSGFYRSLLTQISFPARSSLGIGRKLSFFLKYILFLGKPQPVVGSRSRHYFSKKGVFVSSATYLFL